MSSDTPRLRYLLPKFVGNYTAFMKTLASSCAFADSDIARYRLKVVEFGTKYGWKAATDAFGVRRSTYFLWKLKLNRSLGKLNSLVPTSTRPHLVRQMMVDSRLIAFISSIRQQYGRIGKDKLEILIAAYCQEININPIKATSIGKVISRHRFFYEGKRKYKRRRLGILRTRYAPKEKQPGFIEMDSVIVYSLTGTHVFITALDVFTKQAYCLYTRTHASKRAKQLLLQIVSTHAYPIRIIQTDNGSEFMGLFDEFCQNQSITHLFTYPRSPRINGSIERFNRTIQEEFIERSDSIYLGKDSITSHLNKYLSWYNETRPHNSLGNMSPNTFVQQLQSNM